MCAYGVAGFDSAASLLEATAEAVAGRDYPAMGHSTWLRYPVKASELLPEGVRRAAYAAATGFEGIAQSSIDKVDPGEIAAWATGLYDEPRYPAVMIGSSSGALVHLAAAMRVPWLPQTVMVGVRREGGGVDDPRGDLEQARRCGEQFVAANPEIQLHQMHDPSQDRLSLQYISYFRFKYRKLATAYRRFLTERLPRGSLIIVPDCRKTWPTTRINDRYVFQFGAVGSMEHEEYVNGSERVRAYLEHYGVEQQGWDAPKADGESPEAEWGFEQTLMDDIAAVARDCGHRILRLTFDDPEHLSPVVADLHRDWYGRIDRPAKRLVIGSFVQVEAHWTLRTGSIPFWTTFNCAPSLDCLGRYLDSAPTFDQIRMMIFPHGTESVGLPALEDWRRTLRRGSDDVDFLGVTEDIYPHHFGALARYSEAVRDLDEHLPLPDPLPVADLERFLTESRERYAVGVDYLEAGRSN
jgi:hypothetical protein